MVEERILVVDDDHHLLSAFRRQLGDQFNLETASNGKEAIELARAAVDVQAPFAVALCDMRMPGMDGVETLKILREISPDTVRMMLTGNADQQTAVEAVNQGNIFRFYAKPYPLDLLGDGLRAGIEQYRLTIAERELLEKTVTGCIKALTDIVLLNDPIAYQMATRLRELVQLLQAAFNMPHRWQLEIAASLVALGHVAIPPDLVAKKHRGEALTADEEALFERAPETARDLLANIPRLAGVADIVYLQDRGYDGSGFPPGGPTGKHIPIDARLLKILKDVVIACGGGPLNSAALDVLERNRKRYDPALLAKVRVCVESIASGSAAIAIDMPVASLCAGQIVLSDIRLSNGHLIIPANTQLSQAHILRLGTLRKIFSFVEPVKVRG
jgi:response regulator RpfG family c-di-GMP phosphodiesterase